MSEPVQSLARSLHRARRVLVFTGAGISTDSGIPDYRGPRGVWTTRRPVEYSHFLASERARIESWTMKTEDWEAHAGAKPSAGHLACARLRDAGKLLLLVTQNVDGLHRRAGLGDPDLVEIHGSNARVECTRCHRQDDAAPFYAAFRRDPVPPVCSCGGWWKAATISFGQALREADLERAFRAAGDCDLAISLGSTLSVQPAASIPAAAAARGCPYVVCNQGPTEHDDLPGLHLRLEGPLSQTFVPAVQRAFGEEKSS